MQKFIIKVDRAQAYATVRDGSSFNYQYYSEPVNLQDIDGIWWETRCQQHSAKQEFKKFLETGECPDFSQEIEWCKQWLSENSNNGHEWAGMIRNYEADLQFLTEGYKIYAEKYEATEVTYKVTTLPAYSIGNFMEEKHHPKDSSMPHVDAINFSFTEKGFINK
jgi:hypothetical protein